MASLVPMLDAQWQHYSLYGFLEAVGEYNFCGAWDIGQIADSLLESQLEGLYPPKIADLRAFMFWRGVHKQAVAPASCDSLVRIVMRISRHDAEIVGGGYFTPSVKWCPICVDERVHLIFHQYIGAAFCPIHKVRLLGVCSYCGGSSPYRLQRNSSLFRCSRCRQPLNEPHQKRSASTRFLKVAQATQDNPQQLNMRGREVILPGFDDFQLATMYPDGIGLVQDLKVLFTERYLDSFLRSDSSLSLSKYFHFTERTAREACQAETDDQKNRVLSILREVGALAILSGHRCVQDIEAVDEDDFRSCPCGVGLRLWMQRLQRIYALGAHQCLGIHSIVEHEASHLGLCLSAALFASTQATLINDVRVWQSLMQQFHPSVMNQLGTKMVCQPEDCDVAWIDHRFQWFAVRCSHRYRKVLQQPRLPCANGKRPREFNIVDEINWLLT